MTRNEYFKNLREAWEKGKISEEAYDAGIRNAEYFCDDDDADEEARGITHGAARP